MLDSGNRVGAVCLKQKIAEKNSVMQRKRLVTWVVLFVCRFLIFIDYFSVEKRGVGLERMCLKQLCIKCIQLCRC